MLSFKVASPVKVDKSYGIISSSIEFSAPITNNLTRDFFDIEVISGISNRTVSSRIAFWRNKNATTIEFGLRLFGDITPDMFVAVSLRDKLSPGNVYDSNNGPFVGAPGYSSIKWFP